MAGDAGERSVTAEERQAYEALLAAARRLDAMWSEWHHRKFWHPGVRYQRDAILFDGLPRLRNALAKVPRRGPVAP